MKKLIYLTILKKLIYLTILLVFTFGCGDDPIPDKNPKVEEVENIVTKGKWQITYFFDTDQEETDNYAKYVFQFLPSGSLVANDGPASVSGAWSVGDQNSSNDDSNDLDFNISFTTAPLLDELSDDWEIISATNTKIELRHVSGGNGGTDILTFEKV
jgi:hypothetical protein